MILIEEQKNICIKYNASYCPPNDNEKLGVSEEFILNLSQPIQGLRHTAENETSGWYLWANEEIDQSNALFFKPIHHSHIPKFHPKIEKFLALPPGWRFYYTDTFEDVWYDESLVLSTK